MESIAHHVKDLASIKIAIENDPENKAFSKKGWKPIYTAHPSATILIIGQAPGKIAQESGIPWNDPSGDRLRLWLGVDKEAFYDPDIFALMPMGFCYPGKSNGGDAAPRPECAPKWHQQLLGNMPDISLTLLIGQYAQKYYLKDKAKENLTETVLTYKEFLPTYLPMPHPSPRNVAWFLKNKWFENDLIPILRTEVIKVMSDK